MYYIALIFFYSVNLFADDGGFKPLPNWLFFSIIALLVLSKILIGKLIKNKIKKDDKKSDIGSQDKKQ